jgi:hypothetical protein
MAWICFRWHLRLDGVEETDELLVPVTLHIAADDGAVEDVEGREQCRRAMTLVVVGHRPGATLLHWQAGLGAVERLDLALFIDREDVSAAISTQGAAPTRQAARAARSNIQAGISSHRPDARPERLQRKTSLPAFSTTS